MKDASTKELTDGTVVPPRCWYYLLDFNDRDSWTTLVDNFGKKRLGELTKEEFWKLFEIATNKDLREGK